jgi:hypothetical protein
MAHEGVKNPSGQAVGNKLAACHEKITKAYVVGGEGLKGRSECRPFRFHGAVDYC